MTLMVRTENAFGHEYTTPSLAIFTIGKDIYSVVVWAGRIRTVRHDLQIESDGPESVVYGTEIDETE
jgi:hypothetical protein